LQFESIEQQEDTYLLRLKEIRRRSNSPPPFKNEGSIENLSHFTRKLRKVPNITDHARTSMEFEKRTHSHEIKRRNPPFQQNKKKGTKPALRKESSIS